MMTPDEARASPPRDIGPPPPLEFELRVVVWNVSKCVLRDEKMSDIFVSAYLDGAPTNKLTGKAQTTDTHWRSEDGEGAFNWRIVYPLVLPMATPPRLKLAVWDRDMLKPSDAIAEAVLNLRPLFKKAQKRNQSLHIKRQWLKMYRTGVDGEQGRVEVTIDLLTRHDANNRPAGRGRDEPNAHPFLPEPTRPESSFSPLRIDKAMDQLFWKRYRWYIIGAAVYICVCLCIILLILISVYVPGL